MSQLWKEKIFPKDASETCTLEEKACREEPSEVCDWTAASLMDDFEEFLEAAFEVAHILDGSPPY